VKVSLHSAQASQRPCDGPVSSDTTCWLHDTLIEVDALTGKVAPVERATAICNTFCIDSSMVLVPRHRREVSPLARRVMLQPVSVPLQDGLRFFPPPYPHRHRQYGLTTFRKVDKDGLGALSPPGALRVHDRVLSRPCTRSSAFLAQAYQHLGLVAHHDVYREFTCVHHTIHPAPSPPDAGRYTVPSRFGCQSGDCGYHVRRLWTGRYLPAHLRRILLMEQQVWSLQHARQSTLRPRVAAIN
jgi:hypothetical protein